MADGLSTIDTATLTAAVKSLFRKPLPDSTTLPVLQTAKNDSQNSSAETQSSGRKRKPKTKSTPKKVKTKAKNKTFENNQNEVESAVVSIPDQQQPQHQATVEIPGLEHLSQISPLMIKHLLSCISPLTITDCHSDESHPNNLKLSVENLLIGQHDANTVVNAQNNGSTSVFAVPEVQAVQNQLEEADTPGHVQISASLLQNLLQGISNPQVPAASRQSDHQAPLPSIHHFTSQPIHTLIQSMFPQETNPMLGNTSEAQLPTSSHNISSISPASVADSSAASMLNQLANFTASQSHLNHQPLSHQQNISQTVPVFHPDTQSILQEAMQSMRNHHGDYDEHPIFGQMIHPTLSTTGLQAPVQGNMSENNIRAPIVEGQHLPVVLSNSVNQTAQVMVPVMAVPEAGIQQHPLLLQPTGPGGPLQLISLDKSVNTEVLKEIVEKNISTLPDRNSVTTSSSLMTGNEPRTSNAPVSIQPKPSNHTLENFLQAVQFNTVVIPSVQDNTVDQSNENTPLQGHINEEPQGENIVDSTNYKSTEHINLVDLDENEEVCNQTEILAAKTNICK
ncbi:uncharacterized protein LOC132727124 [Ruditapes philippinarum]|uniref:uncharacterized protein LOC132727124 n=1 Tax=Ruditapes philippinarum TaxID=129788 RepID=UPI00295BD2B3|nr:uncharacterized protein LOC132727124 [Ruditapes philippinarum]